MNPTLNLSSGPHVRDHWTTSYIMHIVLLSLLPTAVIGVIVNGWHALFVILASMVAAVGTEWIYCLLAKKPVSVGDGSAAVTGMMLALSLSPSVPLYIPIIGSIFAILVVKMCFGGLGKNFVNPALAARCFLLISFGRVMTQFPAVDGVSSATPIAELMAGRAVNVTSMFLGTANGVIGGSVIAMLIGGLVLWGLDIIHGEICFSVLGGFALFMGLFGGQGFDPKFIAAHLCGGGVVMGAFFMATDYTTSPVSRLGQLIYGCLIGVMGAMFRIFGDAADSFSYSIIIANLLTPLIDTYIVPKPYAYRKAMLEKAAGGKPKTLSERIPKPVIALTVITLLAGLALSGVYTMTKDTIDAQKEAAKRASYAVVLPEAVSFDGDAAADAKLEELAGGVYGTKFGRSRINDFAVGYDASGAVAGYVVSATSADGFEGDITLSIGILPDGTVKGISFTELNETAGMGSRAGDPAFMGQFENRSVTQFVHNKGGASGDNTIDAISGASTTSGAVVNAVNAGLDFFHSVTGGGK